MPRQGQAFASVLNGQAGEPVFIGTLAAAVSGSVTDLTLADKAKRPLQPGDTVLVGDVKAKVLTAVARGDTALTIAEAVLEAEAGTAVSLLPCDYAVQAATNRATDKLQRGSLFFSVVPDGTSVSAANGTAEASAVTPSCHWRAESPGNALFFGGGGRFVTREGEAAVALAKDLQLHVNTPAEQQLGADQEARTLRTDEDRELPGLRCCRGANAGHVPAGIVAARRSGDGLRRAVLRREHGRRVTASPALAVDIVVGTLASMEFSRQKPIETVGQ